MNIPTTTQLWLFLCHIYTTTVSLGIFQALDGPTEDLREINKKRLLQVASRVQSEYSFRRAAEGTIANLSDLEGTNE